MPLLRKRIEGIKFYIVGSNVPDEILKLRSDDIYVLGYVEKILPLMDKFKISVAPLRYGAGIKGKMASSMAAGLPVISTTLAAEGTKAINNEHFLEANTSIEFCRQVEKIYHDETLWNKISRNGLNHAKEIWGVDQGYSHLSEILSEIGFKINKPNFPLKIYED